ncbi:MAG: sigma factor, partial [Pseudomonadota bacterium]
MFDDSARSGSQMRARLDAAHPDAWRWALSCCRGDRESAMEALHDSYLAILEGRARHSGQSSFKTFLFGVIRLTARATRRKAAFR